jgi:hypothetical protein
MNNSYKKRIIKAFMDAKFHINSLLGETELYKWF